MTNQQARDIKKAKKPFLRRKIGKFLLVLGALMLVGMLYVASWMNYSEYPSDLVEKARSFKVPEGWRESEFKVENRKNGCLVVQCPKVDLSYDIDKKLTAEEFKGFVQSSVIGLDIGNIRCHFSDNKVSSCRINDIKEGVFYDIDLVQFSDEKRVYIRLSETSRTKLPSGEGDL